MPSDAAPENTQHSDSLPANSHPELTSEEFTGLKLGHPYDKAAGLKAVTKSMEHIARESGFLRGNKVLLELNQKGGVDCPGCAWPEPHEHRSRFEYCENGAKAIAEETTLKRVTPEFFARYSVAELATRSDFHIGKSGRLTHPMLLAEGATHYQPVSWDEAFGIIAEELNALSSPDEAVFYTSGRTSNEAAFLYQLFVRQFGTNNLPDCSNMCHESSGCALGESLGVGKGTVSLEDFEKADCIFVIGQNPGTNHPRMLTALQNARMNGCEIISINPLPEAGLLGFQHPQRPTQLLTGGTKLTTHFLPVKINGDVALLKGILKAMLALEDAEPGTVFDHEFIEAHTQGFEAFVADLRATQWDDVIEASGIDRERIETVAQVAANSKRMICCWAMGLTQHKNAVGNIQEVVNLLLVGGHVGREGAGACPVRGHSNVQGDRTMGIYEKPSAAFLDALETEFGFAPPREPGNDVVDSIQAMHAGKIKVFFAMGGNFLSATPDTEFTAEALRRCRLTVHVSTKPHRGHLVTGRRALILPCLGRTERDAQTEGEQFVTVEDSMSVVHSSQGSLEPASDQLLSEPAIVAGLARATFGASATLDWQNLVANYDHIRDHISRVVPGCENYNQRVREPGGFVLYNTARAREWKTTTGKANFTVHPILKWKLDPDELLMMTIRSHDQYNTTIYGLDDRYRGIYNERRVVLMHKDDLAERGLKAGEVVDLTSHFEGEVRTAPHFITVQYDLPRGCVATYFPEANVLVPVRSVAEKSNTPTSKSVVVRVHKAV